MLNNVDKEWYKLSWEDRTSANADLSSTVLDVSFTTHFEAINYKRSIYNLLDFVGDIGGLFDGLKFIGFFFLTIIGNYNLSSAIF